jgi:ABC-type lipoprotein release transport system permease subunit
VLTGIVYGVRLLDPVTFFSVPVLLAAIALIACMIPARRAASVDPIVALRRD